MPCPTSPTDFVRARQFSSTPDQQIGLCHDPPTLVCQKTPQKIDLEPPTALTVNFAKDRPILSITVAKMADVDTPVTLRTRKFIRNPLLGRKQMVV